MSKYDEEYMDSANWESTKIWPGEWNHTLLLERNLWEEIKRENIPTVSVLKGTASGTRLDYSGPSGRIRREQRRRDIAV